MCIECGGNSMNAYEMGRIAGWNGQEISTNPFSVDSSEFTEWDGGHFDGHQDMCLENWLFFFLSKRDVKMLEHEQEWDRENREAEDELEAADYDYDWDEDEPDESMDGDFDSGMASAGFGTDEDYGYYGGDE
jgi:hypothetical protein